MSAKGPIAAAIIASPYIALAFMLVNQHSEPQFEGVKAAPEPAHVSGQILSEFAPQAPRNDNP